VKLGIRKWRAVRWLPIGVLLVAAPIVYAEIYKWVDDQGNVHFGDKPKDSAQLSAEPVKLRESYRPVQRNPQEQTDYELQVQMSREKNQLRLRKSEERLAKESEKKRAGNQQKDDYCAELNERISRFSSVQMIDGVRTTHYVIENGKSVTSSRQREIVAELKAKRDELGCAS